MDLNKKSIVAVVTIPIAVRDGNKNLSNQKMDSVAAYKNAIAELLQHVRFECRYEGLVTLGMEDLRSVLEPISGPVISNMVRNGVCADAAALRAAGFNAYDWELTLGSVPAPSCSPTPLSTPPRIMISDVTPAPNVTPTTVPTSPVAVPVVEEESSDIEQPKQVQPVRRSDRKSKKLDY